MKTRRTLFAVLAAAAAIAVVHLAASGTYSRPHDFRRPTDLDRQDCRVGVLAGYDSERVARSAMPRAQIVGFTEFEDAFMALLAGRIEGFVYNEHVLNVGLRAYPNRFRVLDEALSRSPSVVLVSKRRAELLEPLNRFIRNYRKLGVYEDMFVRWCQSDRYVPMPKIPEVANPKGVLRIGTSGTEEPSSFWDDSGDLVGFDVEFARRFAQMMHLKAEIVCRPDDVILADLAEGRLDLVIDDYNANEAKSGMLVSEGYFDSDMKVLVKGGDDSGMMLGSGRLGYSRRLIKDPRIALFVEGFLSTLALTLLAAIFGFLLAVALRALARHAFSWVDEAIVIALEVVRLLPPPVVILIFSCVVFAGTSAWVTAVAAFAVWFAAFVEPVLPLGPRPCVSLAKDKLIELMQWTSVVGALGVCDLTLAADLVCGKSLAALAPLMSVAAAYCLMNWIVKRLGEALERRVAP